MALLKMSKATSPWAPAITPAVTAATAANSSTAITIMRTSSSGGWLFLPPGETAWTGTYYPRHRVSDIRT
jgi:hypothetical protein